ncbi:unnamed protein product [Caenorhabditis sp. 36 PRJEB53466]|nr:unnamed protein product [Caenorhabditis sp. 36 PRJEB53466]
MIGTTNLHPNKVGCLIAGRYLINKMIDYGVMGAVYEVKDHKENDLKAVKLVRTKNKKNQAEPTLKSEIESLRRLYGQEGISLLHSVETLENFTVLVLRLEGKSLRRVRKANELQRFQPKTVQLLALSALKAVQTIHKFGILHTDIKEANFTLPLENEPRLVLVDFGQSIKVIDDNGERIKYTKGSSVQKSVLGSLSVNNGGEQTEADEMIMFGYFVLQLAGYDMAQARPGGSAERQRAKVELRDTPETLLLYDQRFLCSVLRVLHAQVPGKAVDYNAIQQAIIGCTEYDPNYRLGWKVLKDTWTFD